MRHLGDPLTRCLAGGDARAPLSCASRPRRQEYDKGAHRRWGGGVMICVSCRTEDPSPGRFCRQSGSALPFACPSCGTISNRDDKFCLVRLPPAHLYRLCASSERPLLRTTCRGEQSATPYRSRSATQCARLAARDLIRLISGRHVPCATGSIGCGCESARYRSVCLSLYDQPARCRQGEGR
jgi:hypothetical protein